MWSLNPEHAARGDDLMSDPSRFSRGLVAALLLTLSGGLAWVITAQAQPSGVEPQADQLLRRMTNYIGGLRQFSVDTHSTIEVVMPSGQKLQYDNDAALSVQRPNKLLARRRGDLIDQAFYYDGKTLSLYNPKEKVYATVPAPGTIEAMLDFARESLDLVAPASDLVYRNA